jgi:hypothetical protein
VVESGLTVKSFIDAAIGMRLNKRVESPEVSIGGYDLSQMKKHAAYKPPLPHLLKAAISTPWSQEEAFDFRNKYNTDVKIDLTDPPGRGLFVGLSGIVPSGAYRPGAPTTWWGRVKRWLIADAEKFARRVRKLWGASLTVSFTTDSEDSSDSSSSRYPTPFTSDFDGHPSGFRGLTKKEFETWKKIGPGHLSTNPFLPTLLGRPPKRGT